MKLGERIDESLRIVDNILYLTPEAYTSGRIIEYDIKAANITMLSKDNLISPDYAFFLSNLPKQVREVEIGMLIRSNSRFYESIAKGIKEAKRELIMANNIDPDNIVRVANDAVYINSSYDLKVTQFNGVAFVKKSIYDSMLSLVKGLTIFLSIYKDNNLDISVKGINEYNQELHKDYFMTFLANIMYLMQRGSKEDVFELYNKFYKDYVELKLPIEYYREFNSASMFKIKHKDYYVNTPISDIGLIDINHNLYLLRNLYSIILQYK